METVKDFLLKDEGLIENMHKLIADLRNIQQDVALYATSIAAFKKPVKLMAYRLEHLESTQFMTMYRTFTPKDIQALQLAFITFGNSCTYSYLLLNKRQKNYPPQTDESGYLIGDTAKRYRLKGGIVHAHFYIGRTRYNVRFIKRVYKGLHRVEVSNKQQGTMYLNEDNGGYYKVSTGTTYYGDTSTFELIQRTATTIAQYYNIAAGAGKAAA